MRCVFAVFLMVMMVGALLPLLSAAPEMPHHDMPQNNAMHVSSSDTKAHDCCGDICTCDMLPCAACHSVLPNMHGMMALSMMTYDFNTTKNDVWRFDYAVRIERPPRV